MDDFLKVGETYKVPGYNVKIITQDTRGNFIGEARLIYGKSETPSFIFLYGGNGEYKGWACNDGPLVSIVGADPVYDIKPPIKITYKCVYNDTSVDSSHYTSLESHQEVVGVFVYENEKLHTFLPINDFCKSYTNAGYPL